MAFPFGTTRLFSVSNSPSKSQLWHKIDTNTAQIIRALVHKYQKYGNLSLFKLKRPIILMVKPKYKIQNWSEYDKALVNRGDITVWFAADYVQNNWSVTPTGKPGAPQVYSNEAIQMLLMLKSVYKLPYRMLEGFSRSIMRQMNLELRIPDHTTMSRRACTVKVADSSHKCNG